MLQKPDRQGGCVDRSCSAAIAQSTLPYGRVPAIPKPVDLFLEKIPRTCYAGVAPIGQNAIYALRGKSTKSLADSIRRVDW